MVVGHEEHVKNFTALVKTGELAQGYIFFGPKGVGKKHFAEHLANLLETAGSNPSGQGEWDISHGILGDSFVIEKGEGGSIGIDAVREIRNFLSQKPNRSSKKTVIIDNADLLGVDAQNALLKMAEEPFPSGLLILITQDLEGLNPTLQSRFQKIFFGPIGEEKTAKWLIAEKAPEAKAKAAAKAARGKPGLAKQILADKEFIEMQKRAAGFLKISPTKRREFLKELLELEDFRLTDFLDAVILCVAMNDVAQNGKFWHRLLELRQAADYSPLNPRLQLEALLAQP